MSHSLNSDDHYEDLAQRLDALTGSVGISPALLASESSLEASQTLVQKIASMPLTISHSLLRD
jgi:hypothetical protein